MKRFSVQIAVVTTIIMIMTVPGFSYAVEPGTFGAEETPAVEEAEGVKGEKDPASEDMTKVTVAATVEEAASLAPAADADPFFSVDVSDKDAAEKVPDEKAGQIIDEAMSESGSVAAKEEAVMGALEESGLYMAQAADGGSIDVVSNYAYRRIILTAEEKDEINAYGAVDAVYHDDCYYLTYESEEAAKAAHEALCEEYGAEAVLNDWPVKAQADIKSWGTKYMAIDKELEKTSGGSQITVAVLDTGINRSHEIFKDKTILQGYDFVNNDSDPKDDGNHGTMVTGVVAESTPSSVRILPIKVLDSKGEGSMGNILKGLDYAEKNGAVISNMSFGAILNAVKNMGDISSAEARFKKYKMLMISASGNDGVNLDENNIVMVPAELTPVICVGAINRAPSRYHKSNYGENVDFAAPGEAIVLAQSDGKTYDVNTGTSFAAPHVTAAAAIIKSQKMMFAPADLKEALIDISRDLGTKGKDIYYGYGCPVFGIVDINSLRASFANASPVVKLPSTTRVYNGKYITQRISVRTSLGLLTPGRDYSVTYKSNRAVGTARMTITGKINYKGSITRTFKIIPKSTKIRKLKKGRKSIKVTWARQSTKMPSKRISGYQVQTAVNKKFTKRVKTKRIKGYKKTSVKIYNLSAKRKYYVRVRTYMKTGGKTYYSNWSKVRSVRTR